MNISVFGLGYVGCVNAGCLANMGNKIIGVDINEEKIAMLNKGVPPVFENNLNEIINNNFLKGRINATSSVKQAIQDTDVSLICVGTPNNERGQLTIDIVEKVVADIAYLLKEKKNHHTIIIRSTVPPGTIKKLEKTTAIQSKKEVNKDISIVMNPEFLREGSAISDFFNPPYTLIGSNSDLGNQITQKIYSDIETELIITKPEIAEMIKFVNNAYHALKITFANEIGNICHDLNIDSIELMELFTQDRQLNISSKYFKPGFAYGGSCLPKDLKGLRFLSSECGIETPVLSALERSNKLQIKRLINMIQSLAEERIGFLGLSFKENTDDVRNSPIIPVIRYFLDRNYGISVYDKNIRFDTVMGANKDFLDEHLPEYDKIVCGSVKDVIAKSRLLVIVNRDEVYGKELKSQIGKKIIDLVRLIQDYPETENYFTLN